MQLFIALIAALGVISAALIAGFFSYSNIISSKENKVSEFRLSWINGLREEIANYTSGVQDLARLQALISGMKPEDKSNASTEERRIQAYTLRKDAFDRVVTNLSKIQLRLNPEKVANDPDSDEAKLLLAVRASRDLLKSEKFKEAIASCTDIRDKAAPILKSTWVTVRDGELAYNKTKKAARNIIVFLLILLSMSYALLGIAIKKNWGSTAAPAASEVNIYK